MTPSRRTALGVGLGLLAWPAAAQSPRDAAPPATDIEAWSGYETRLRARLADAGGGRFDTAAGREAYALANAARAAAGAAPLSWHSDLARTARAHAADLARRGYLEHLSPEGFDPSHRFWLVSRTTVGSPTENIAYHRENGASATADQLVRLWRASPGHWGNLLRPSHTHAGFGVVRTRDRAWLVGLFARPLASLGAPLPFRATAEQVATAIASLPGEIRPRLMPPQGSRPGGAAGVAPVLQIAGLRRGDGAVEAVGGPIFVATPA